MIVPCSPEQFAKYRATVAHNMNENHKKKIISYYNIRDSSFWDIQTTWPVLAFEQDNRLQDVHLGMAFPATKACKATIMISRSVECVLLYIYTIIIYLESITCQISQQYIEAKSPSHWNRLRPPCLCSPLKQVAHIAGQGSDELALHTTPCLAKENQMWALGVAAIAQTLKQVTAN